MFFNYFGPQRLKASNQHLDRCENRRPFKHLDASACHLCFFKVRKVQIWLTFDDKSNLDVGSLCGSIVRFLFKHVLAQFQLFFLSAIRFWCQDASKKVKLLCRALLFEKIPTTSRWFYQTTASWILICLNSGTEHARSSDHSVSENGRFGVDIWHFLLVRFKLWIFTGISIL